MEEDAFYEYTAPRAEKAGYEKGFAIRYEKGYASGRERRSALGRKLERECAAEFQRSAVSAAVCDRFRGVPVPLTSAFSWAQSVESLLEMRVYTLTQASSLDDVACMRRRSVLAALIDGNEFLPC